MFSARTSGEANVSINAERARPDIVPPPSSLSTRQVLLSTAAPGPSKRTARSEATRTKGIWVFCVRPNNVTPVSTTITRPTTISPCSRLSTSRSPGRSEDRSSESDSVASGFEAPVGGTARVYKYGLGAVAFNEVSDLSDLSITSSSYAQLNRSLFVVLWPFLLLGRNVKPETVNAPRLRTSRTGIHGVARRAADTDAS